MKTNESLENKTKKSALRLASNRLSQQSNPDLNQHRRSGKGLRKWHLFLLLTSQHKISRSMLKAWSMHPSQILSLLYKCLNQNQSKWNSNHRSIWKSFSNCLQTRRIARSSVFLKTFLIRWGSLRLRTVYQARTHWLRSLWRSKTTRLKGNQTFTCFKTTKS